MSTNANILDVYNVTYVDQGEALSKVITQQIAALRDSSYPSITPDLFLGAVGGIKMNVAGRNSLYIQQKGDSDYTTQIAAINTQSLEIKPGDSYRTTAVGSLSIYENVTKQYITTSKNTLVLDDNVEITGTVIIGGDYLAQGALIGNSLNVMRDFNNNQKIGFGFRIDDASNLELYKYDNQTNISKRVLTFGRGELTGVSDTITFPQYGSNTTNTNSGINYATQSKDTFWTSNGTDIYFLDRIGIGLSNPSYDIHTVGTICGDVIKDSSLTIQDGNIFNASNVFANKLISSDGSAIEQLNATYITKGVLQAAIMPNVFSMTNLTCDVITSTKLTVNGDIIFTGNLYKNADLYGGGDSGSGYWTYDSTYIALYYDAGNVGIGTTNPSCILDLNDTSAIRVPVGSTTDRSAFSNNWKTGMLRYNSTTSGFEGYSGSNWTGLGGVIDVNQDTYISAEITPGCNNDQLRFYTFGNQRMIIDNTGNIGVATSNPSCALDINTSTAFKVPVGTSTDRNAFSNNWNTGMLRYNTTTSGFEGYSGSNWTGLGGVIDVNQDTYISAEITPGCNNDQLRFYTAGSNRMTIDKTSNIYLKSHLIPVDDVTYDLGSDSNSWRDLYLSGSTIHLGKSKLTTNTTTGNVTIKNSNDNLVTLIVDTIQIGTSNTITLKADSTGLTVTSVATQSSLQTWAYSNNSSNIYTAASNVGIGTVTASYPLDVFGATRFSSITQSNSYNMYPPLLSSNIQTYSNLPSGNGQYIVSVSGQLSSNSTGFYAFDSNTSSVWESSNSFSNGLYIGPSNINNYFGAFINLSMPKAIVLDSFRLTNKYGSNSTAPSLFKLFGSSNNSNWNVVYDNSSNNTVWTYTQDTKIFTINSKNNSYNNYSLVINQTNSNASTTSIAEWILYEKIINNNTGTTLFATSNLVGIGTASPKATLHIENSAVIASTSNILSVTVGTVQSNFLIGSFQFRETSGSIANNDIGGSPWALTSCTFTTGSKGPGALVITSTSWATPTSLSATSTSYSFWHYPTSIQSYSTFIYNISNNYYHLISQSGTLGCYGSSFTSANYTYVINTWYHIVLTMTTSSWKLYVNGTLVSTITTAQTASTSPVTRFFNSVYSQAPVGYIEDFKYWSGVILSQSDVNALYANNGKTYQASSINTLVPITSNTLSLSVTNNNVSQFSVTSFGNIGIGTSVPAAKLHISHDPGTSVYYMPQSTYLAAIFNFNEASGSTAINLIDNTKNMTLSGSYSRITATYNNGKALYISGVANATTPNFSNTTTSIGFWWYCQSSNSGDVRIVATNTGNYIHIFVRNMVLGMWNGSWNPSTVTTVINTWYYIVATMSGAIYNLYVNGTLVLTNISFFNNTSYPINYFFDYYAGTGQNPIGLFEDIRIWSGVALSSTEIAYMYNAKGNYYYTSPLTSFLLSSSNVSLLAINNTGNVGIGSTIPTCAIDINTSDAIRIPSGSSLQRPSSNVRGMLRYNTTTSTFEGYSGTVWSGLGGVIDVAGTTYISAENSPGAANQQLKFVTAGTQRMMVDTGGQVTMTSTLGVSGALTCGAFTNASTGNGATINGCLVILNGNNDGSRLLSAMDNSLTNNSTRYLCFGKTAGSINNSAEIGYNHVSDGSSTNYLSFGFYGGATMYVSGGGNVGIGLTNPGSKLSVNGTINVSGAATLSSTLGVTGATTLSSTLGVTGATTLNSTLGVTGAITSTANTTSPSLTLTNGEINTSFTDNKVQIAFGYSGTSQYQHFIHTRHNSSAISDNAIDFYTCDSTASNTLNIGATHNMSLNAGNVGIGITNPSYKLQVSGNLYVLNESVIGSYLQVYGTTTLNSTLQVLSDTSLSGSLLLGGSALFSSALQVSGVGIFNSTLQVSGSTALLNSLYVNGNVGINSSLPQVALDINSTSAIKLPVGTTVNRANFTAANGMLRYNSSTAQFEGFSSNSWSSLGGVLDVNRDTYISAETSAGSNNDQLQFYTNNSRRMIIDSNGYIGFGTTIPSYPFDVASIANFKSSIIVNCNIGINTLNPRVALDINSTSAIRMPSGTTNDRVLFSNTWAPGMFRYNTTLSQFEGYTNSNWTGIGGVLDANQDTYISAETGPGVNNDQLQFFTSNTRSILIDSNAYIGFGYNNLSLPGPKYPFDVNTYAHFRSNVTIKSGYNIGIGTTLPVVVLDIISSNAIRLPVGTSADRAFFSNVWNTGMIRYNSSASQFEGYTNSNWINLVGTMDVNQDTYISAETIPGSNNDQLQFYTCNQRRMIIDSNGYIGFGLCNIGISVPEVSFDVGGPAKFRSNVSINNAVVGSVSSHLIPSSNTTYDLGSSNNRWRELWLSGNTLHIGNTVFKVDEQTSNVILKNYDNSYNTLSVGNIQLYQSNNTSAPYTLNVDSSGSLALKNYDGTTANSFNASVFNSETSNVYYTGHTYKKTYTASSSNTITYSTYSTIMGMTAKFLDLSFLNIPTNAPISRINNYLLQASATITINITATLDGSTAYIGDNSNNPPLYTYSSACNISQGVTLLSNQYIAIKGMV